MTPQPSAARRHRHVHAIRRSAAMLGLCALLGATMATADTATPDIPAPDTAAANAATTGATTPAIAELESPGGIPFLHAPMPQADSVSIRIAWPSDWAYTESAVAAPFIGGDLMLAGGAGDLSAADVQQGFADLQVEGGLGALPDHVFGSLTMPARDPGPALEIAAKVLVDPLLDERWFERLRDQGAANVADTTRETGMQVQGALSRLLFGDTSLQRSLTLEPTTLVSDLSLDEVKRWHHDTFVRDGATIVVAGAVEAEAAGRAVDALIGGLPAREGAPPVPSVEADFSPRSVLLHRPDAAKSAIALLGRLPPRADGGEIEDVIATLALGGEGAPLMQALRTKLRAAYGVNAVLIDETATLRGLQIYVEVDPDKLTEARAALREAYAGFMRDGPSADAVTAARRQLGDGFRETLASPASLADTVLASSLDGFPPERIGRLVDTTEAMSADAVKARLDAAWPSAESLIEVVSSSDADAVDGACVVESFDELDDCGAP